MTPRLRLSRRLAAGTPIACLVALVFAAAAGAERQAAPTPEEARAFIDRAERELKELAVRSSRAGWVQSTYITVDTEAIAAEANEALVGATTAAAKEAARFRDLQLPPDVARKIDLLRVALPMAAPANPEELAELTRIATSLESDYGKGVYCPGGAGTDGRKTDGRKEECLDITAIERIMAESRDPEKLLDVWVGWRTISPKMRERYARFVELSNKGARELGFADTGAMWRSKYDMPPEAFVADLERLWSEVRPLYESLHAYVRRRLSEHYGEAVVPRNGLIPAHVLGNPWAQEWGNIYPLVAPKDSDRGFDLTERLRAKGIDARGMVRMGEAFFTSLGFDPLPQTFWQRSLFTKPADRDVVCHASAWSIDYKDDVRLKMCIQIRADDFVTVHHELGHTFYQLAYNEQPLLFQDSANDAFHEAIGDTIALSVTPAYLKQVGLLDDVPPESSDIGVLLNEALDKVAFLPFGLLIDQWRFRVFSGEITPANYNAGWWELRRRYQGIAPPVPRTEEHFDPGAKYHVPANYPYTRYFLARILQFQFHRALCEAAGRKGPLHRCSIYGSREAGERLRRMLAMGASRPWPDALEALTGQRRVDATAMLDYFAPLKKWLDEQNKGEKVGW
ncbi:MAG TPA: M2 family metallopeptidase [Vicinamibacterales bacterium]|nr:M2 family metallopeptidase [Vicinamibacterales bacterium]